MKIILLANFFGLLGCATDVIVGLFKTKKQILYGQLVQFGFNTIANLLLGGFAAALSNALSGIRNIYIFKYPFGTKEKLVFIFILCGLSFYFNTLGWLGVIPIFTTALITWYLDSDAKTIKIVLIIILILWFYYNFTVMNYVSAVFNLFTIATNIIGLIRIKKEEAIL